MKIEDLLKLYQQDSIIHTLATKIHTQNIQLKGIVGSLDAVIVAACYQANPQNQIIILNDKEEAAYFTHDLQNLLPHKEILLFPTSYKNAYQYEEIENANMLMRVEVLNKLSQKNTEHELIVTYPEALSEKVIQRKTFVANTLAMKVNDHVELTNFSAALVGHQFEHVDFVYEAGQFSIRGGIIDIFSYANALPYRIELMGNTIESIRTFNPETQLSEKNVEKITIVPSAHHQVQQEIQQAFLQFIPDKTTVWAKDIQLTLEVIQKSYEKAEAQFYTILETSQHTSVVSKPDLLFETKESFQEELFKHYCIEFGNRFYQKNTELIIYKSSPQPSFNKNFKLLVENLNENQGNHYTNIITAESAKQFDRLRTIFEELEPGLQFLDLNISLREGFIDQNLKIACYTDHQIFERFHKYKIKEKFSKSKAITLKELKSLKIGDYVTHIDHGVGRFAGLEKIQVNDKEQEAIRLVYRDDDLLYVNIHALHKITKYGSKEGNLPTISKLGSPEWENKKSRAKKQVKDIAKELIGLYAKRRVSAGYAFSKDSFLQAELESSFLYEDTPDQAKATADVKADMEQSYPMDRLVCGDVGFGKTEIAIRAAFKALCDGKQVAVLVPTTILAMQHYHTFQERLQSFPCSISYINRFKTSQQIKETLKELAKGNVNVIIGTHRLLSKDVAFKDIGLLIVDEEQKFGVKAKERIKEIRLNVDVLTLTATPIPRTLHFSLMGARDLSVIATPPPNRQPVTTEIHTFDEVVLRDAISFELRRGGQVFFVHNRIGDIEEIGNIILRLVPDAKIGVAHGQMDGERLEKAMLKFIEGEYDVLVSTNIIESGLDIPNANTIMINQAHMFGLSDLHQMRGRVGRSNKKAFCYLLIPSALSLTTEARKRLQTLEEFSDLGDGFKVAMRDLDIRGAGNLLGAEQSGFINDLGFEAYHKILDETIQELKENEFKELFSKEINLKDLIQDCTIETDLQLLIPETYVGNVSERLSLYTQLDNLKTEEELEKFKQAVEDRFGNLPIEVQDLIKTVRLRWLCKELGFEKISIKNETLKGYFTSPDNEKYYNSDRFGKVLDFLKKNPTKATLKENKGKLTIIFQGIRSVNEAINALNLF